MEDIRSWVDSRFPKVSNAGAYEVNVPCPFCGEDPSKRGRLYINIDPNMDPPGLFHCKLCDERGAWNKLRKHFGDPIITSNDEITYDSVRPKIFEEAVSFYYQCLADNDKPFEYLTEERFFEFQTIEKFRLGYACGGLKQHLSSKGFSLADMVRVGLVNDLGKDVLYNHIVLPIIVSGNVISLRGRSLTPNDQRKYVSLKNDKAYLFNSDVVWNKPEELIICEGEFDAITLTQLGFAAVGVPGSTTWQEAWNGYVEPDMVKRLFVCYDTDDPGRKGAEKLVDKLGGRPKIITLPEEGLDVNKWFIDGGTKEEFDGLLRSSSGGILISVREAFEAWKELEGNPNLRGMKFGIARLDEAIKPGLLPGQVMVTLAKTGAGKTISMLNFMHRMKKEQPEKTFLFFSLEQTRNEWFERARRIHKFYEPSASIKSTISFWENNFMMVDKNKVTPEELYACILQFEYEMGKKPDMISVDYLGYFANGFPGKSSYERTSRAIMEIKAIAKDVGIPFYVPHQVSRLNDPGQEPDLSSARDSGVIEETADFLLALWAPDQKQGQEVVDRTGVVSTKLLKSRHGGVNTRMDMLFTPKTLAMIPENDPLYYKAADEIRLVKIGDDLDTVVYRNLTGWDGTIVDEEVLKHMEELKRDGYM